jgi:hypothetical protein
MKIYLAVLLFGTLLAAIRARSPAKPPLTAALDIGNASEP